MTVIVTKLPGGVSQLFNPDTGKITYKCKKDHAYYPIDAFGGIVKFNKKGSSVTVSGANTTIDDCVVIKNSDNEYKSALKEFLNSLKQHQLDEQKILQEQISDIESKL